MNWAQAFAKQACSDFAAREHVLRSRSLPSCHHLHYLQMAMEKAAKAHLIAGGCDPMALQGSHAYVAKVIPAIVKFSLGQTMEKVPPWMMKAVRAWSRRVELLHPQVDDNGTVPANCEYPWQAPEGNVLTPAEHDFPGITVPDSTFVARTIKEVWSRSKSLSGQ